MCFDIRNDEEGCISKKREVFWSEKASTAEQKQSMFEVKQTMEEVDCDNFLGQTMVVLTLLHLHFD